MAGNTYRFGPRVHSAEVFPIEGKDEAVLRILYEDKELRLTIDRTEAASLFDEVRQHFGF